MRKLFITNLLLLLTLNLLIKPFYIFGIDRGVQNAVGPEEYGLYFALFNFAYLFQILHDFGIQNFNHVHFSKAPELHKKYLPKILGSKLNLIGLYFIAVLAFAILLGYDELIMPLLGLIALNHVLASLSLLMRTSLSAQGYYRLDSLLSVLDKLIMIILVGALLWAPNGLGDFQIEWFVYAQTISFAIATIVGATFLAVKGDVSWLRVRFSRKFSFWLLRSALPFALLLVLMTLYTRMDAVMLERLLEDGSYQAGVYAAGYRILDAANMAGVLFAGLLIPMFSKLMIDPRQLAELVRVSFRALWSIAICVTTISWFFATDIMEMLYPAATAEWSEVFRILMLTYLFTCAIYVYGTLLTSAEKLAQMNKVFLVGVLVNFMLNLYLIPRYAAWGSAVATLVTQGLVSISLVFLCIQLVPLQDHAKRLLAPLLFGLVAVGLGCACVLLPIDWKLQVVCFSVASLGLAFAMKMISTETVRELLAATP